MYQRNHQQQFLFYILKDLFVKSQWQFPYPYVFINKHIYYIYTM
jgi:hypothetical protein